jgi:hypothetical protein
MIRFPACLYGLLLLTAISACGESVVHNSADDKSASHLSQPQDSAYARMIDQQIDSLYKRLSGHPMPKREAMYMHAVEDSVSLWFADSSAALLQIWVYPPDAEIWPAFFIIDGEIALVRFREWRDKGKLPFMRESMIYYKEGKPFYCEERSMQGQAGEKPFLLRLRPFILSPRTLREIQADYADFWPKLISQYPALGRYKTP